MEYKIPIVEIFGPVLQGEGMLIGQPTIFVRSGGCDSRCNWCDTMYAVDAAKYKNSWLKMTPYAIFEKVKELSKTPILITLSGGNPALHDFTRLIELSALHGFDVAVETQGTEFPDWMYDVQYITVSPKPISAGYGVLNDDFLERLKKYSGLHVFKVPIMNKEDLDIVQDLKDRKLGPICIQPVNANLKSYDDSEVELNRHRDYLLRKMEMLAQEIYDRGWYDVNVLPQLHVLMFGNRRGV